MDSEPVLKAEVEHRLGPLRLQVRLELQAAWTVLFGPSGSGKSTLLRVIAGLERPDSGRVEVLGSTVLDRARGVDVAAHRRPVRWAGQREALFPQMTVRENVGCGLGGAAGKELDRAVRVFGLEPLAEARPGELSGGQRQRVSVARAAVGARGRLLLLDEPFAGLDDGVRDELIPALREWLEGTPVILVTHDVAEAFLLGAEVVRLAEGRVVAQGAAAKVLAEERLRMLEVLDGTKA